jgi:hypothetical protein
MPHAMPSRWDVHVVAKNCGTSVAMIERFYSKFDVRSAADQLANEKNSVRCAGGQLALDQGAGLNSVTVRSKMPSSASA